MPINHRNTALILLFLLTGCHAQDSRKTVAEADAGPKWKHGLAFLTLGSPYLLIAPDGQALMLGGAVGDAMDNKLVAIVKKEPSDRSCEYVVYEGDMLIKIVPLGRDGKDNFVGLHDIKNERKYLFKDRKKFSLLIGRHNIEESAVCNLE